MSVDIYKTLQIENEKYLPILSKGNLSIENKIVNKSDLQSIVSRYSDIECGWFMYTDEVTISTNLTADKDLLEAQLRIKDKSIHIKYLQNNLYSVVVMMEEIGPNCNNDNLAYYDQEVFLRQDLPGKYDYQLVTYRLWYKKNDAPSLKGRWEGYVQQFIGFK